jgi:hypothetical protein
MKSNKDLEFFELRVAGKAYFSKVFTHRAALTEEKVRYVRMVLEDNDQLLVGEIEGALCLRLTGEKRKTQVSAIVTSDHQHIRRLTLETFKSRAGEWYKAYESDSFSFREDEFRQLIRFLDQMKFVDATNQDTFQVEDISTGTGRRLIVDADDRGVIARVKALPHEQRAAVLDALQRDLSVEEVNILLGRRKGLDQFERQMTLSEWSELQWQDFFDREQWVFGYGLDYRIMRAFGREVTVGGVGTDNRNKPLLDFLQTFMDYTVLVEIKRPDTEIFKKKSGSSARSGTWEFTPQFIGAVTQILEQKAEWTVFAQSGENYNRETGEELAARTRNAKAILVFGSSAEFGRTGTPRDANIKRDTFELFRRETRSIDIVTFDELLERARFITQNV